LEGGEGLLLSRSQAALNGCKGPEWVRRALVAILHVEKEGKVERKNKKEGEGGDERRDGG